MLSQHGGWPRVEGEVSHLLGVERVLCDAAEAAFDTQGDAASAVALVATLSDLLARVAAKGAVSAGAVWALVPRLGCSTSLGERVKRSSGVGEVVKGREAPVVLIDILED